MASHRVLEVNGSMRFSIPPGFKLSDGHFDVIKVHCDALLPESGAVIKQVMGDPCSILLYKPTIALVLMFGNLGFDAPVDFKFMVMQQKGKDFSTPSTSALAFINPRFLKRLAVTHQGGWFKHAEAEIVYLNMFGATSKTNIPQSMLDAAVEWRIFEKQRNNGYRAMEWILRSFEDDIADKQAEHSGHDV